MKKRTLRKRYKLIDPIAHAIEGAMVTPKDVLDKQRAVERAAAEAVRMGAGSMADLYEIESSCLVAMEMASHRIGPEALVSCKLLEIEIRQAKERHAKTGALALTGAGLRAMDDVLEYIDLQRQSISRGEYERHILKVVRRTQGWK